ncbi:type III secretion system export apparatus subunit SctS [Limnobacter humi]|uniref:Type III secretion system export apparatus subunit SctS n=1 Tax=Limnobacter humi TaxID=1778671 RepID=A0ABT1WDF0_9BURK|nr:type III secretion system export apparatus subunit SctS [Limnobacter humi]MCQ8895549.1 type III secretion system export apparatus subunit SctS [Limnobacter humi]
MLSYYIKQALLITLYISAPVVLMTVIVGLVLGILQAVMQLQDQALPFAVKLVGTVFIFLILGGWMSQLLVQFAESLFASIPSMPTL